MAEKLVNDAGLSEFATKIKESVPLIGTIGSGTAPSLITVEKITATQSDLISNIVYFTLDKSIADYDALWINASISATATGGAAADTVPLSGEIQQFVLKEGSSYPTLYNNYSEAQRFTKARDIVVMTTNFYTTHFGLEMRVSANNTGQAMSGQVYRDWLSSVTATGGSATIYGIKFA